MATCVRRRISTSSPTQTPPISNALSTRCAHSAPLSLRRKGGVSTRSKTGRSSGRAATSPPIPISAASTSSSSREEYLVTRQLHEDAVDSDLLGVPVRICSLARLREMKRAQGRAQDIADLETCRRNSGVTWPPMEAATAAREPWTFAQKAIVVLAALQLLWATAGLIAEPSIDFGEDAVTERVLGVDFNGVHALSGFLLFLPAFYFALRPKWALYYAIYVAGALIATGIWALFDDPAGLGLHLPQQLCRRHLPHRHRHRLRRRRVDPARPGSAATTHPTLTTPEGGQCRMRCSRTRCWCRRRGGRGRGSRRS